MYHRYLGQDTENFDSVAVSSELFDKVVKKYSVDDLEFITYSLIIDGGTRDLLRYNNSLPVAVMDKILNRGVYTLFSRKVENAIKNDIINNLTGAKTNLLSQSVNNDLIRMIDKFLNRFDDLSEKQRIVDTTFILLSMFQKGLFVISKYFTYLEDFKIYVDLNELLPFIEPSRLREYLKIVSSEYFETLSRICSIYDVKHKKPNYEIFLYSEKEGWKKVEDKFKSYKRKDEIFVFRFANTHISNTIMYSVIGVNSITFVPNGQRVLIFPESL